MAIYSQADLEQTDAALYRLHRDRLGNQGTTLGGFQTPGGSIESIPGDIAPYARVPPFPQEGQGFGVVALGPLGPTAQKLAISHSDAESLWPVLDVTNWRTLTLFARYRAHAAGGILSVIPRYGLDTPLLAGGFADLSPLAVPSAAAPTLLDPPYTTAQPSQYASTSLAPQELRTLSAVNNTEQLLMVTLDVSRFRTFSISACEANQSFGPPNQSLAAFFVSMAM